MNDFIFAVYKDYSENKRVGQMADEIDCLSCEILADPGVIRFNAKGKREAWKKAKELAKEHKCDQLENMTENYKFIDV